MNKINLAFIGCGFVAQQCHLPCYVSLDYVNIHTLCDPIADLRDKLANQYAAKFQYNSHEEIKNIEDIDAFIVTLPRKLSFHVLKYLIKFRKPIFTEKPLCLDTKNALILKDLAIKYSTYLKIGYMKSHDNSINHLKEIINDSYMTNQKIKLINAYSFMGDSYCSPFGDFKGKDSPKINFKEESLPDWLDSNNFYGYEQFINVFSHITHIIEDIFKKDINIISCKVNEYGEGIILSEINGIPLSLSLCRGEQNKWEEGIDIKFNKKIISIKFAAPFLRNIPATIYINEGTEFNRNIEIRPTWSWAFKNQAIDFCKKVNDGHFDYSELNQAIRQIEFAEKIFKNYIN